jgi:hypothetical protein
MLRHIVRIAAALVVTGAIVGCAASDSEGEDPTEQPSATESSALRIELIQVGKLGDCQLRNHCGVWKPGKKYRGGGYTVCWAQPDDNCHYGLVNYYGVWDHTGITRNLKLDLRRNTDSHCHTIDGFGYSKFAVDENGLDDNSVPRALFSC